MGKNFAHLCYFDDDINEWRSMSCFDASENDLELLNTHYTNLDVVKGLISGAWIKKIEPTADASHSGCPSGEPLSISPQDIIDDEDTYSKYVFEYKDGKWNMRDVVKEGRELKWI